MAHLFTSQKTISQKNDNLSDSIFDEDENKPNTCNVVLFVSITEPMSTLKPWLDAGVQVSHFIFINLERVWSECRIYNSRLKKLP
jgi:hypothetical protein